MYTDVIFVSTNFLLSFLKQRGPNVIFSCWDYCTLLNNMHLAPRDGHVRFKPMGIAAVISFETNFHWKMLAPYKAELSAGLAVLQIVKKFLFIMIRTAMI